MHFEFTQAVTENLAELSKLVNSAYRGESSRKGWTTEADLLDGQRTDIFTLKKLIETEGSVILIAQDEATDKIHGCVNLKREQEKCYLGMLTVDPELQNKGLGKQLLDEAEAFAMFWDCTSIYMTVISLRKELIEWYERHEYVRTGEKSPFPYGDATFGIPRVEELEFIMLKKHI